MLRPPLKIYNVVVIWKMMYTKGLFIKVGLNKTVLLNSD